MHRLISWQVSEGQDLAVGTADLPFLIIGGAGGSGHDCGLNWSYDGGFGTGQFDYYQRS